VSTKEFIGENGKVKALKTVRVEWKNGKHERSRGQREARFRPISSAGHGLRGPVKRGLLEQLRRRKDARGNVKATTDGDGCYATSVAKVFAAGDMRRGQSLVVWAIREGRQCAREVDPS
jgi:glutamate synthase (NADPH/NADH) small chain